MIIAAAVTPQKFSFPNFRATNMLNFQNSVKQDDVVLLAGKTQETTSSMWFAEPINFAAKFTTTFSFRLDSHGGDVC